MGIVESRCNCHCHGQHGKYDACLQNKCEHCETIMKTSNSGRTSISGKTKIEDKIKDILQATSGWNGGYGLIVPKQVGKLLKGMGYEGNYSIAQNIPEPKQQKGKNE